MLIALWIVNGLLALTFLGAGLNKVIRPKTALAKSGMAYTEDFRAGTIKLIGALEVLAAIGLIVPLATGIAPVLAPLAAIGLLIIMIGAVVVHARRKESALAVVVIGLIALASAIIGFIVVLG